MAQFLVIARENEYDTSATPIGVFQTMDAAESEIEKRFRDVRLHDEQPGYVGWIFDSYIHGEDFDAPPVLSYTGYNRANRGCTTNTWKIAIVQYGDTQ